MANIVDKIVGIFTNQNDPVDKKDINDPEQQTIYDMVRSDYQYFKATRQASEGIWRQEQRFYKGDHWYGLRPPEVSQQRPNSVDNVVWSQIESIVSKLTGWEPTTDFEAQEPGDEQKAEMLNEFIPYELRCIKFHPKHTRAVRRMVIHGPLIYKTVFDPSVAGGRGNNRYMGQNDVIPLDLGSFFPDPRIRDFIYLQKASANIIHTIPSLDYFKQRWPDRGKLVTMDNMSDDVEIFDRDYVSQTQFNTSSSTGHVTEQSQRSGLIEYWYKGKPKTMSAEDKKVFKELADTNLQEGKDPSINIAKAKGQIDGIHCIYISTSGVFLEHKSYVYDHGQYPIVARVLFPDEDNPWGKGYMRDMISPQIMLNKFSELSVETMAKQGNAAIVYMEGSITKPDTWARKRSTPAAMLPVNDMNGWKEIEGHNVPSSLFQGMEYYKEMLQKIPGQFDSANGQASADVNSGAQAQALIAASSGRLSLPSEIIKDALQEVFEQYIELVAQFYTQERIIRVTDGQMSVSRQSLVSQAPTTYDAPQQDGSTQPQQVQEEYVPHFDIIVNIGAEKPQDRQYWVQTALTLLQTVDPTTGMGMIDAKAVQYTIQNGRMEPMQVIQDRMDAEGKQMQMIKQLQDKIQQDDQEIQVLQQQVEQLHGHLSDAEQHNMQGHTEALQAADASQAQEHDQQLRSNDQMLKAQQQAHQQQIEKANTMVNAAKVVQMGQKQVSGQK